MRRNSTLIGQGIVTMAPALIPKIVSIAMPVSSARPNTIDASAAQISAKELLRPLIDPMRCASNRSVHAVVITPLAAPQPTPSSAKKP